MNINAAPWSGLTLLPVSEALTRLCASGHFADGGLMPDFGRRPSCLNAQKNCETLRRFLHNSVPTPPM